MNKNATNSEKIECSLCGSELKRALKACPYCGKWINRRDRFFYHYLIPVFMGALIGAICYHYGQSFEQRRQERISIERQNKINDQAITLLKIELSQNYATLNNVEELTKANLTDLSENKIAITPLGHFSFETWDFVRLNKADFLFKSDTADFTILRNCYFVLRILENKIKDREQFRLLKEGSANFKERLSSLDKNILKNIEPARKHIEDAQEYLYRIHDWKVKRRSYYQLGDGRIETLKNDENEQ